MTLTREWSPLPGKTVTNWLNHTLGQACNTSFFSVVLSLCWCSFLCNCVYYWAGISTIWWHNLLMFNMGTAQDRLLRAACNQAILEQFCDELYYIDVQITCWLVCWWPLKAAERHVLCVNLSLYSWFARLLQATHKLDNGVVASAAAKQAQEWYWSYALTAWVDAPQPWTITDKSGVFAWTFWI